MVFWFHPWLFQYVQEVYELADLEGGGLGMKTLALLCDQLFVFNYWSIQK